MRQFNIEFNGYDYVVVEQGRVIVAFSTLEDAFEAKREFEEKPACSIDLKVPPAMRLAKMQLYGVAS
ncbi:MULTISPECIES: hypothetical protein [Thiomicrorhabdus]|uniref:Uncharacterized protein n=1 Tax=Thiomicrorhabdus xiamenensis TaxID=2739063 RepID=A0A7D4TD07_9GAMM|nr:MULTISPECIES: hypothetical protein [Thiomicrorhabdus]MBO1925060.1 hypothetical protein [Thiomicrorhabdus sp. 6S3-12]QKI88367.1 hypothetical protein HQN79_01645 [Thiomicrorhabdus xiamenensis]